MTDKPIRVGFIGAGANTRKHHIPKLKTQLGVELVAVANRSKESGEKVAREFGIGRVHGSWQEIVNAPDIDAVCIGTWPYMHAEMTVAALGQGMPPREAGRSWIAAALVVEPDRLQVRVRLPLAELKALSKQAAPRPPAVARAGARSCRARTRARRRPRRH